MTNEQEAELKSKISNWLFIAFVAGVCVGYITGKLL